MEKLPGAPGLLALKGDPPQGGGQKQVDFHEVQAAVSRAPVPFTSIALCAVADQRHASFSGAPRKIPGIKKSRFCLQSNPAILAPVFRVKYLPTLGIHSRTDAAVMPRELTRERIESGNACEWYSERLRQPQRGCNPDADPGERSRPDASHDQMQVAELPPRTPKQVSNVFKQP